MANIQTPADSNSTLATTSQSTLGNADSAVAEKDIVEVDTEALEGVNSNGVSSQEDEKVNLVHWDSDDDPQNPMNWSSARKWVTIGLISVSSFNVYVMPWRKKRNQASSTEEADLPRHRSMVSTVFAPGVPEVEKEFNSTSSAMSSLMVSIYVMGSALGPLFLTPLTEVSGRLPITHFANILFMVAAVVCAAAINMPMLILARFVMGIASSVPVTVGGGFVADLMPMEKRGTAMTVWTVGPLMGFVCGPIFGGYIVETIGWRWTVWLEAIIGAVVVITSLIFLRETYAPKLLERKALRLQKATGRQYRTEYDQDKSVGRLMSISITRPILFLVRSPIVLIVSLYSAVTYSYMYVLFTTFTQVFETQYGFSPGQAGLAYLGLGLGFAVGQITIGYFSDRYMKKQAAIHGKMKPEHRLPPLALGCCLIPVGLFWYGWAAEYKVHWFITIAGTFFVGLGIYYVHLVTQVYLVDAYTLYAASAVAAELSVRCVFGAVIPLAGPDLYAKVGLGWGNSILAFIAVAFAPTSFFLIKYGERIRTNPKFQPKLT